MLDFIKFYEREIERIQNEFRDHESSYAAYVAAQESRRSMQTHLDSLAQLLGPALAASDEAQKHIQAIKEGLASQNANLDALLESVPPRARKPAGAAELAHNLFTIPEILEWILLYLKPADLLRVQRVNHQFLDAIQGSPKIQCRMGLRPQEKGHVFLPPPSCDPGRLSCYIETYPCFSRENIKENEVVLKIGFSGGEDKPPYLGPRCREMLVCQPPIKSMNVYTRCCRPPWSWRSLNDPLETITADSGIRMGDIIDAYNRITADHRLCPYADPPEHGPDGFVKPRVTFEAVVAAEADDKLLVEKKQNDLRRKEEEAQITAHSQRMRPYITAKQSGGSASFLRWFFLYLMYCVARDNGQPIPTLAEFEAANPGG